MRLIHFILLLYCFGNIRTKNESGRSLTFVIDRSYSLQLLIKQFKEASLNLTSKLMGRKSSDIVNVTLIVFDDPTYKLVVDTTDISEFEKNLKSLETYYDIKNKDCPEMSLSALKMALTRSLPRSYILLFTDATAKDVWLLDEVKILSKEKQSKVFFILTGTCEDATKAERKIYSDIATETSGAVLHIHNNNTLEIINSFDFLKNEINSIITETTHDPDKTYEVQADEGVGDITVLASGEALEFKVNCANPLCKVNYDRFSNTTNIAKVNNPKGKVNVSLKGKGDVFISAYYYATFNFTYGFSTDTPARIEDTRTKREIFKLNYLAINVTGNEHNCRINEALVTDLNDTQLIYLTLKLKMVSDYFYVTEKAGFPRNSFKLVITGVDIKTGQSVRSVAIIEGAPHKSRAVVNENESVFIPRSLATRNANYGIEWNYMSKLPERKRYYKIPFAHKETETGLILPNVSLGHNGEYECIERSHSKGNSENFYVTKQKTILEVTKAPTAIGERYSNLKVQYGNRIEMMCAIKGHPQPRMRWYNSNNVLLSPTSQKYPDFVYRSILTVESVKKSEKYLCRASNKVGQISVEVNVTVLGDRPKFRQSVIITAVMEGTDAVIRCKIAEGKPKPTIKWIVNSKSPNTNKELSSHIGEELILRNITLSQAGHYICVAENTFGRAQQDTDLIVQAPPKILRREDVPKGIVGDVALSVPCTVSGYPVPTVVWKANDTVTLHSGSKYNITKGNTLIINNLEHADAYTKYTCVAKNTFGKVNQTFDDIIYERPKFRKPVITTSVMEGRDAVIPCKIAEGKPKPTIKWIVNSKSPNTNKELSSHIGEELILRNITLSQAGHYICVAENTFGRAQQDTDLIVQAPPKILRREDVPKGIVGDVALSVPCTVYGYPVPTVVWKANDTVTLHSGSKYNITKGNTLIINNLEHADAYTKYTCVAKNTFGEVNQTFDDIIYERPKFRKPVITTSVMEGRDAVIPCKIAEGKPKPTIKWIVNSKSPNTNKELSSHIGEELILRNITLSQAGHYICVAENTFGRAQQDTDLIVQAPPKILRREDVPKGIVGDVALSVPCTVSGYPVPTVVWKANDTVTLHSGSKYNITEGNTLIINNLEHADAYTNYTCVAKNTFGEVNQTFSHIISEGLVHFGEFREIHSLENETVKISCPTPNAGGYTIRWFEDKKQMKTNESYLKLEKLKEESVEYYTCRVSDRNGSNSTTFEVNVGKKPRFLAYHSPLVKWQGQNSLDCKVSTSPSTNTIQWFHNGNLIVNVTTNDTAPLAWRVFDWGQYVCQIKNIHGTLTRSFNVTSDECLIKENLRRTVSNEPLLLSDTLEWPKVTKTNNFLNIKTETYTVACPNDGTSTNSFLHIPGESQVEATCAYEDKFWVKGKLFKYTDLNCLRDYQLGVIETKQRCHEGAELVKIGYNMNDFFNLFDVCFDYNNKRPVYSHVMMSEFLAQDEKRIDPCEGCYAMGKLVNPTDVVGSGLIQESYTYSTIINAVLIWQPPPETDKNKKRISFQDLEKEVHLLTRMFENIEVWTGTYKYIEIDGQTVPKYLWKVVGIPENDDMKVAYVYVNHPNESDADIWCDGTSAEECNELLNFKLDKYAYCCDIQTFYKETRFSF
ncbi:hemicentin-1-like [Bombyx mandarina]|uniref:Hemicentin-1-like n=1 Tax=Bombyx mandarina TaxID=7092 RepID=A0A6J2JCH3_BOMMA|nr:hemicentin-1-like [Bombyx mandarina]